MIILEFRNNLQGLFHNILYTYPDTTVPKIDEISRNNKELNCVHLI